VSAARLIADSGAKAVDAQGSSLSVSLESYELIDFNRSGTAHVYLQARDNAGQVTTVLLTITITP
jgi:hypothetical protein